MIRVLGREVEIAWDHVLEGLDGFEYFWDERRWSMWRDPHQRLGYLVAMLVGLAFWIGMALHPRSFETHPVLWIAFGSSAFLLTWFGVAAASRARASR